MQSLTFQNYEFGELNVILIDGKEYFPATQCAKIIGHENPSRAVRKFCKCATEMVAPTAGGIQEVNYIPEGDLYHLIKYLYKFFFINFVHYYILTFGTRNDIIQLWNSKVR